MLRIYLLLGDTSIILLYFTKNYKITKFETHSRVKLNPIRSHIQLLFNSFCEQLTNTKKLNSTCPGDCSRKSIIFYHLLNYFQRVLTHYPYEMLVALETLRDTINKSQTIP